MFLLIKFNRKVLLILALVVLTTFTLSGCGKPPEGAVAKVDGDFISKTDFDENFNMYKKVYQQQFGEDIMSKDAGNGKTFEEAIREQVLEKLIVEKIILNYAEKNNITVTDEEVNKQIASYKEVLGGEENYKSFLTKNNITDEYFKQGIRKEMIIDKYRTDYVSKIKIDDKEAKKHFEENKDTYIKLRASHILVETEDSAKAILEKINNGEDFHALAGKESIDTNTAVKGGDLGYFRKGEMAKEFEDAAFKLKPGEVSDIIKTDHGFHIIKLDERVDKYADLKDDVIADMKNVKYNENLKKMRADAKVKIYMEEEKPVNKEGTKKEEKK